MPFFRLMLKYTCCSFSTNKCIYQIGIGKSTFSHLVFSNFFFLGECVTFHRFYHAKINYYRIFFPVPFFSFWLEIIQSYFVSYFLKKQKKIPLQVDCSIDIYFNANRILLISMLKWEIWDLPWPLIQQNFRTWTSWIGFEMT